MDGVPGLSFHGISPGDSYLYRFNVKQAGAYEHVVLLSEWTDEDPARVLAKLKKQSDYYNFNQRTIGTFFSDIGSKGLGTILSDRLMWGGMRMKPTDLADVSGYTYTYLMNGTAPNGNWTGIFNKGERVLLRFINGSSMTYFEVRIPGMKMTVVAADGQYVHPITLDEFRIAVAETFDVIVEPAGQEAYTILSQSMDRTGYAAGTLATLAGLKADIPKLDARQLLTMADMGHGDGSDPHAGHNIPSPAPQDAHAGHNVSGTLQSHPFSEKGNPLVDSQVMAPTARLDDRGVGLRGNGRKVLTYKDLKSLFEDPDGRGPERTFA
jgi:CopA family copper-resistance protein